MTTWILVYIVLTHHGHPISEEMGRYESMRDCFFARENLAIDLGSQSGYFPVNTQAVCVRHNPEE